MINQLVQQLVHQAIELQLIMKEDEIYCRNQVLGLLTLSDYKEIKKTNIKMESIADTLDLIVDYACQQGIIDDIFDEKEILISKLMNCFLDRPSAINSWFYKKYANHPKAATDAFFELSINSQYIQMNRIRKNIEYKYVTKYGELDITINLSKPEKDPKSIAKEQSVKKSDYPTCLLCIENEGYVGRVGHPARSNHRMIRVNLLEKTWYLQYSPYMYYNEHCIVLSESHSDMKIDRATFNRLLAFVEQFPHYFLGSNADLPIVGGSILSHDHYQGGRYEFAMAKAKDDWTFTIQGYEEVRCAVVKWPMSVIRLRSDKKEAIINTAELILKVWQNYSDPSLNILEKSKDIPHNTITPIARRREDYYELDLVLRNNRTDDKHLFGIFHPHDDVHHIKKENIGLIEVMGLAVLPGRLKQELKDVEQYILGQSNSVAHEHLDWAIQLKKEYETLVGSCTTESFIKEAVGRKFLKAIEDSAVFKRTQEGLVGFQKFIHSLNTVKT